MPDPVPALDQVLGALSATLGAAGSLAGVLVEVDRPDDNPFDNAELPALNIIERRTRFSQRDQGTTVHAAEVDIDMIVDTEAASTNAAQLRLLEAKVIAALWADRTLGGLVEDIGWDMSGAPEDVHCDDGARPLSLQILFLTPIGDHFTVGDPFL